MLGTISPRYILSLLGGSFIALFNVGVSLLMFDQIKRDEISRIHEVISSKPVQNIELFTGRLLGAMLLMSVSMILVLIAIIIYGVLVDVFSIPFGEPIIFGSVVSLVLFDITPNFLFFGSLAILFSLLFQSRLLAILLTLSGIVALFWLNSRLPLEISRPLQTVSGNVLFPSELAPTLVTPMILLNRIALFLFSVGFIYWSSGLYKRVSPTQPSHLIVGSTSILIGLSLIGGMLTVQSLSNGQIDKWVVTHNEHFDPSSFPDVIEIRGSVDIKPGRMIALNLELDVSLDSDRDIDYVLFSFNPGYSISYLAAAGERVNDHEFRHGLLKIPATYFSSEVTTLEVVAKGRPNIRFAYLDSIKTLSNIVGSDVRQLRHLGTENAIFHSKFVALLPGIKWYPISGTSTNEDDWLHRKQDFFKLDLEVFVPQNWIVAGPAMRKSKSDLVPRNYRFRQPNPIPEFALVGSQFESASVEVEGVLFEVLFSSAHHATFKTFEPAVSAIRHRLQSIMANLSARGFVYPYDSMTLVEVPSVLRVFGGGKKMSTVMCPPGMFMIRESTIPTFPLEALLDKSSHQARKQHSISEEIWQTWRVQAIEDYFNHPMFESNIKANFYRNLLTHQTQATGPGAHTLQALLQELSLGPFYPYPAYFYLDLALDRNLLDIASVNIGEIFATYRDLSARDSKLELHKRWLARLNSSSVWNLVESVEFHFDEFGEEHIGLAHRALNYRTRKLAEYLQDAIPSELLTRALTDLRNIYLGKNYSYDEFVNVFANQVILLEDLVGDMIDVSNLPGFIATNPTMKELVHPDHTFYEMTFTLINGEPIAGPVSLALSFQNSLFGHISVDVSPPLLMEANQSVEIVLESPNPIRHVWVRPYLSQNRTDLRVDLPLSTDFRSIEYVQNVKPQIKSIQAVEWEEQELSAITVDDLDVDFSVFNEPPTSTFDRTVSRLVRQFFGSEEVYWDQGLIEFQHDISWNNGTWLRIVDPTAFGKYRRTFAMASGGDGAATVIFSTELPRLGEWQLEYHLPHGQVEQSIRYLEDFQFNTTNFIGGTIYLEVHHGIIKSPMVLSNSGFDRGWQDLGIFNITDTDVAVVVSSKTDKLGTSVFADAVRWKSIESK